MRNSMWGRNQEPASILTEVPVVSTAYRIKGRFSQIYCFSVSAGFGNGKLIRRWKEDKGNYYESGFQKA